VLLFPWGGDFFEWDESRIPRTKHGYAILKDVGGSSRWMERVQLKYPGNALTGQFAGSSKIDGSKKGGFEPEDTRGKKKQAYCLTAKGGGASSLKS